jgi:hypothetical protein
MERASPHRAESTLAMRPQIFTIVIAAMASIVASGATPDTLSEKLPDPACPSVIRTTVPGWSPFASMKAVHTALETCPDLTTLQLFITGFGCSDWPDRENLPLTPTSNPPIRYLPSLRVLELEGYQFGEILSHRYGFRLTAGLLPNITINGPSGFFPFTIDLGLSNWFDAWDWRFRNWQQWHSLKNVPEDRLRLDNLDLLLEALDTQDIHTLAIKDPCTSNGECPDLRRLARAVPALTTLTIHGRLGSCYGRSCRYGKCEDSNTTAIPFITSIPPSTSLTNLTWVDGRDTDTASLVAVLERHGPTLEHLQWRTDEFGNSRRPVFTPADLATLGRRAPRLKSLTIDLDRNGTAWPLAHLDAIAVSMPRLTNLTIYIPLSSPEGATAARGGWIPSDDSYDPDYNIHQGPILDNDKLFASPRPTTDAVTELFAHLRAAKVGTPLETVQFRAGDWTRSYHGPLRHGSQWLEDRTEWFRCTAPRDGGEPLCERRELTEMPDGVYTRAEWADVSGGAPWGMSVLEEEEVQRALEEPWERMEGRAYYDW